MRRHLAFLVVLLSFCIPAVGTSPLDGHFYLSKPTFSAGEPIFLIFVVKNIGNEPVTIKTAAPSGICSEYEIEVEGASYIQLTGTGLINGATAIGTPLSFVNGLFYVAQAGDTAYYNLTANNLTSSDGTSLRIRAIKI